MHLELEFGITVTNPATQSVKQIAKENLDKVRSVRRLNHDHDKWKPYVVGQTVWVKRPQTGKFGRKWIGPYKVVNKLGVTYHIWSNDGKVKVVHHDNLKLGYIPSDSGRVVSPGCKPSNFTVVHSLPQHPVLPPPLCQLRGEHPIGQCYDLQPHICPPVHYSYDTS